MNLSMDKPADENGALKAISDTVQHVVTAISAALGVDVAIVDNDCKLVATSKTFLETRGTDINRNFIRQVYRKGTAVITNPGSHDFCRGCKNEGNCPETAEVLRVIEQDGKRYGVLLMVAYTSAQKEKFLNNTSELLEFIGEMSNLIYDEIRLQKSLEKEKLVKRQLETTVNFVDDGIITIDRQGFITQMNNQAKTILGIGNQATSGMLSKNILPEPIIDQLLKDGKDIKRCELKTAQPYQYHCLLYANPVTVNNQVMGAVIRVQDFRELRSAVYEFSVEQIETTFDDIYGESDIIQKIKAHASSISQSDSTVLVLGESGTGKELFARAIHANSKRRKNPFIAINCAAIPEMLLESELFGYDEGAFSGARKGGKPGKFEMADCGTVFLDEIGDMPLHMQAKILRVLQEAVIERVGGVATTPVNVRIIAATNQELGNLVKNGGFRKDLFYRLNVVPISIPPLRKRKQDIPGLANQFLKKYNLKMQKQLESLSDEAMELLIAYHWPGNVRELQNAIEYAINVEKSSKIQPGSLPSDIIRHSSSKIGSLSLADKVREYEKLLINEILESFETTVEGKRLAAKELGISLPTLYRKLKELKIGPNNGKR